MIVIYKLALCLLQTEVEHVSVTEVGEVPLYRPFGRGGGGIPRAASFFFGVRIWLGMTFNFKGRVKVLGSVNSNHNHNPKHI